MAEAKTVLFLSNHFITLYNFRRELIARLLSRGHRVVLSMPAMEENEYFRELGCEIIDTPMSRRGMDPLEDLRLLRQYRRILRELKPDVVFSYTIKPNIYGSMASRSLGYRQVCNVTGTGATFLHENLLARLVRMLYRLSLRRCYKVFFQNAGDRDYFVKHGMVRDNWELLPGSGVNLEQFTPSPMPDGEEIGFLYIGRIMAVKGIEQFLDCAAAVRERFPQSRFYMAGFVEETRYQPILDDYAARGVIQYLGFRKDIGDWIKRCCCTVLPSLGGEGVPNVLLESAASGRVCIASDVNGSREAVDDGVTGWLFPAGDSAALIDRAERFLRLSRDEREAMGRAARRKMEREVDRELVISRYLEEAEQ